MNTCFIIYLQIYHISIQVNIYNRRCIQAVQSILHFSLFFNISDNWMTGVLLSIWKWIYEPSGDYYFVTVPQAHCWNAISRAWAVVFELLGALGLNSSILRGGCSQLSGLSRLSTDHLLHFALVAEAETALPSFLQPEQSPARSRLLHWTFSSVAATWEPA